MVREIRRAFFKSDHYNDENDEESYQFDFDQDEWWVTERETGQQWLVVDLGSGNFDFVPLE